MPKPTGRIRIGYDLNDQMDPLNKIEMFDGIEIILRGFEKEFIEIPDYMNQNQSASGQWSGASVWCAQSPWQFAD
jgi:hypothetical protein